MPSNKIDKPLVVYRFSKVTEWCPLLRCVKDGKILTFSHQKCDFKVILMSCVKLNLTFVLLYYWIYFTHCEKEIKWSAILAFYLFSSTHLMNSIKHEHSCKILYTLIDSYTVKPVLSGHSKIGKTSLNGKWFRCLFWFDSLRPSQQLFSYVRMGLPGLNQY